jgi:hypothetical protein
LREIIRKGKEEAKKQKIAYTGFEIDHTDRLTYCKQCGATFFTRKQGKLRCFDCGWCARESWFLGECSDTPIDSELDSNRKTTEGVPNREKWLKPKRLLFNPQGTKWSPDAGKNFDDFFEEIEEEIKEEIKSDPRFEVTLADYQTTFSGATREELAEELGIKSDTLGKKIARQEYSMYPGVNIPRTAGNYFCVVTRGGRNYLKMLGKADAPLTEILDAFINEWYKGEKSAKKQARDNAEEVGADQQTREQMERDAVEHNRAAYDVVIGLLVPDEEGFNGTPHYFPGLEYLMIAEARERLARADAE